MEEPQRMILRWLETLPSYDFDVVFRPGTQHGNANSLSRADHATPLAMGADADQPLYDVPPSGVSALDHLVRVAPDCNRSYCEDSFSGYSGSV